jgi:hypothetical protein
MAGRVHLQKEKALVVTLVGLGAKANWLRGKPSVVKCF